MGFTMEFLGNLCRMLFSGLPLFFGLTLIISLLSILAGRIERWPVGDSLYFGFITALTVGYGDMRPVTGRGRLLSIVIALFGLVTTGIIVALALEAASQTYAVHHPAGRPG